jgi:hypothetical protein
MTERVHAANVVIGWGMRSHNITTQRFDATREPRSHVRILPREPVGKPAILRELQRMADRVTAI